MQILSEAKWKSSIPRTIFNTQLNSRRSIIICDLPLNPVKKMAHQMGGSINDVLLAVCGGALRHYLLERNALPRSSLVAGMPVSLKSSEEGEGNKLCFAIASCPTEQPGVEQLGKRLKESYRNLRQASSAA